ncbi:alpha/beta-type small acid-soluble spore protein [Paenibacillus senegalensis]|uniref:alpha/beta-type small acid-soluble spore protein n=1 Tax=Paenibacillus senegalensis TaxID=1465766 RepID=UPI00028940E7|nr:alpha/beta-type small acid-soluble spore protein [Paenibacillus senegalensis]
MARNRRRRPVPAAGSSNWIKHFKADVMRKEGYTVDPANPDNVKFEVARRAGVPLRESDNGSLPTQAAGRVGGRIGGPMVREMIRVAQEQLIKQQNQ